VLFTRERFQNNGKTSGFTKILGFGGFGSARVWATMGGSVRL